MFVNLILSGWDLLTQNRAREKGEKCVTEKTAAFFYHI